MPPVDLQGSRASSTRMLDVDAINNLDDKEAHGLLTSCSHCAWWAEQMVQRRPFADLEQIEVASQLVWSQATQAQWLAAFAGHPLIGDVEHLRKKFDSRAISEQGQIMSTSTAVLEDLARLNRDYAVRHGFIFIICATGKSAEDMLAALQSRIGRSTESERITAAREHAAITQLRLVAWLKTQQAAQPESGHVS